MTVSGGCRCGACRYEVALDAVTAVYCCHCTDCQRWTGSAFSEQAVVPERAITAVGPVIDYTLATPSGRQSHQYACGTCHARLWNVSSLRPDLAIIRAGTLDENRSLEPRAHIWVKSKQPWIVLDEDVPQWPEGPDLEGFFAALSR